MAEDSEPERRLPRLELVEGLEIHDPETGDPLGHLSDVSRDGLKVQSTCEFQEGERRWFELRRDDIYTDTIPCVEAICMWTIDSTDPLGEPTESGWKLTGEANLAARALLLSSAARLRRDAS